MILSSVLYCACKGHEAGTRKCIGGFKILFSFEPFFFLFACDEATVLELRNTFQHFTCSWCLNSKLLYKVENPEILFRTSCCFVWVYRNQSDLRLAALFPQPIRNLSKRLKKCWNLLVYLHFKSALTYTVDTAEIIYKKGEICFLKYWNKLIAERLF